MLPWIQRWRWIITDSFNVNLLVIYDEPLTVGVTFLHQRRPEGGITSQPVLPLTVCPPNWVRLALIWVPWKSWPKRLSLKKPRLRNRDFSTSCAGQGAYPRPVPTFP